MIPPPVLALGMSRYDPFDDGRSAGGATPQGNPSYLDDDEYDPGASIGGASPAPSVGSMASSYGAKSRRHKGASTPGSEYDPSASLHATTPGTLSESGLGPDYDAGEAANPFGDAAPWCSLGAELIIEQTGETCKVVGFGADGEAAVAIRYGGGRRSVRPSGLRPVPPAKNDKARAFAGDYAGKQGTMDGVDEGDGILKVIVYGETDFAIVQMADVVKVADW